MEELQLGPNGALMYCMEYLLENLDWLQVELNEFDDDEYLLIDCPGQMELYTHVPVMRRIINQTQLWGYRSMVSVFVIDATFVCDAPKFISGSLLSLSAMIALELPNINVLSKCDLVDKEEVDRILDVESATLLWDAEEYCASRRHDLNVTPVSGAAYSTLASDKLQREIRERRRQRNRLTEAICSLLDDFHMVSFIPLDITEEESLDLVLASADHAVNYGEDLEVRGMDFADNAGGEEDYE